MILSIITTTKNDQTRLNKTIESCKIFCKSQRVEHVIVDGNSEDRSVELIKEYQARHPNVIYRSENDMGIYDGMNKGIDLSSGRYLIFLNSGDEFIINPDRLINFLESSVKEDGQILCFPYLHRWEKLMLKKYPLAYSIRRLPSSHQAMIFSRDFIIENTYNLKYKLAADFDVFHRADKTRIHSIRNFPPLTLVEAEGVSSMNPIKSYVEYCKIVWSKYTPITSIIINMGIVAKAISVVFIKKIIPKNGLIRIRSYFGETYD